MTRQNVKPAGQFFGQILGHEGVGNRKRQGPHALATFSGKHAPDSVKIERVGNQEVQSVGRDADDMSAGDFPDGAVDGSGVRIVNVDLDEISGHENGYRVGIPVANILSV